MYTRIAGGLGASSNVSISYLCIRLLCDAVPYNAPPIVSSLGYSRVTILLPT